MSSEQLTEDSAKDTTEQAPEQTPETTTATTEAAEMNKSGDKGDDNITDQMKNTKAQVMGTFQKLSSSLQKMGTKITGAFSSSKEKVSK